jgi:hypothetical protein
MSASEKIKTLLSQGKSTKQILKEMEGERTGAGNPITPGLIYATKSSKKGGKKKTETKTKGMTNEAYMIAKTLTPKQREGLGLDDAFDDFAESYAKKLAEAKANVNELERMFKVKSLSYMIGKKAARK